MWIVNVQKQTENNAHVWLSEGRQLENGCLISTGKRTPKFSFDLLRGSFDNMANRLRRSITVLTAESILAVDEETLLIAAELGEQLHDVIVDSTQDETGGDEVE